MKGSGPFHDGSGEELMFNDLHMKLSARIHSSLALAPPTGGGGIWG